MCKKVVLKETKTTAKEKRNEEHYNSRFFSDVMYHLFSHTKLYMTEQKETRTVN